MARKSRIRIRLRFLRTMFLQSNPYTQFNWAAVTPINADPYFYYRNQAPYTENYMFSFQRQITAIALLTISYAGNQGHHLLALLPTNPGNRGAMR